MAEQMTKVISIRVNQELYDSFIGQCNINGINYTSVLKDLISNYALGKDNTKDQSEKRNELVLWSELERLKMMVSLNTNILFALGKEDQDIQEISKNMPNFYEGMN